MRSEPVPTALLALLVLVLIGAGLWVVGSPFTARQERRDQARLEDLQQLRNFVQCVSDGRLPETLDPNDGCAGGRLPLNDPFTGAPYRYLRLSDTAYRLCGDFERPETASGVYFLGGRFDPATGCLDDDLRD